MSATGTRSRAAEAADTIDILRAISIAQAIAQAAECGIIILPATAAPPAGSPGDDPVSQGKLADGRKLPGEAGRAAISPPPDGARPAVTSHFAPGWVARALPGQAPLLAVLAVQSVLAARLVRSNTAFSDEALYLWAGHLQWAHWLHGEPLPAFPAYMSGAPVLYPPLGALADSIGGLTGARVLSLFFMLGATALLYATASRIAGKTAGFFAAALWAFLGPVLHLSAFATYDAMALCLLALSGYCAVRAGERRDAAGWLFAAAIALALACAAAYSCALFAPVVAAVVLCASAQGAKVAAMRAAALVAVTAAAVVLLATAGGGLYYAGLSQTVFNRVASDNSAPSVLAQAWVWTWPVVVPALAGAVIACLPGLCRRRRALLIVLAGAALLVPLEQARIRTGTSLDKHAAFGAWFAAIAAGYAVARALEIIPLARWRKAAAAGACAALLVAPAGYGLAQGRALFAAWPNATPFIAVLGPLLAHARGQVLVETSPVAEYYLPQGSQWTRWSSTFAIMFASGHGEGPGVGQVFGPNVYSPLIHSGYWSLIALNFGSASVGLDREIAGWLDHERAYQRLGTVPYGTGHYTIWALR